ncbi:MAG: hypothetical protein KGZ25_06480, partial [Planctomycetes bacterium]|nr:hypothetical protein [Planctomycetota bacterium]
GAIKTDRYDQLRDGITIEGTYWTLEAAIPWAEIGADPPEPGSTIRGDFGYLQSDEHGTHTTGRVYWSGKTQKVVSDTPSEARLRPALWGQFVVTKSDARLHFIEPVGTTPPSVLEEEDDGGFGDDILQELGE